MKAWIQTDKDDALWLVVDDGEGHETAHPILNGEVEAIHDACAIWLEEHDRA